MRDVIKRQAKLRNKSICGNGHPRWVMQICHEHFSIHGAEILAWEWSIAWELIIALCVRRMPRIRALWIRLATRAPTATGICEAHDKHEASF